MFKRKGERRNGNSKQLINPEEIACDGNSGDMKLGKETLRKTVKDNVQPSNPNKEKPKENFDDLYLLRKMTKLTFLCFFTNKCYFYI